jgi:diguanylate cyclase (GGDEF)-like protein
MVASWGDGAGPFAPYFCLDECWGVRQGRPHHAADGWDPVCRHLGPHDGGRLCLPMAVQGEMLGVLSLGTRRAGGLTERERRAAKAIAEQAALSLANLRLQEALRDKSRRDALTGLFNRRYLDETLGREFARARREGRPVAVVMTDVDHFKRFNDVYGHEAGDAVLAAVAGVLSASVRGEDVACRYGGEEFCLVMPGADLETARRRAEEVRKTVAELDLSHRSRAVGPITLSAGVATFPARGEAEVVAAADAALYRAKRTGRNRVAADEGDVGNGLAVEDIRSELLAAV